MNAVDDARTHRQTDRQTDTLATVTHDDEQVSQSESRHYYRQ